MASRTPVVVDSSVWVDYFRKGKGPASQLLDELLDGNQAAICGIIEMELLAGLRPTDGFVSNLLGALPYLEVVREDFVQAGLFIQHLRSHGVTVPASDALIAALCIRLNLPLLTMDKHFKYFKDLTRL